MIITCDKHLINELKKRGYDIDYKTFVQIYRVSRRNPDVTAKRKNRRKSYFKYF